MRKRHDPRVLFALVAIAMLFIGGCLSANDPRINPKMRYSLELEVLGELRRVGYTVTEQDFKIIRYLWRNPETLREESLMLYEKREGVDAPTGFVYAYDLDFDRRCGLRESITSTKNHWKPPPRVSDRLSP